MPLLTVGITYYNEGPLLTECLKSFWAGKVRPDEILIYDDASGTRPEAFVPAEIPVRIIRSEKNQGPAKGRNLLLQEAQGEWIHFHDSDDWVKPDWAEKVLAKATPDCDLVLTEVTSYQDGKPLSESIVGFRDFKSTQELLRFGIEKFILVPSGVIRTEVARNLKGYRESLWQSEDWDFYVRLLATHPRFEVITENLVGIQIRKESRSQRKIETLTCVIQAILLLQKELPNENLPDLSEKAAWVGSQLFQLGEIKLAREAFEIAQTLGPTPYRHRKSSYRLLAKCLGPEMAEWISLGYRRILPPHLRKLFQN